MNGLRGPKGNTGPDGSTGPIGSTGPFRYWDGVKRVYIEYSINSDDRFITFLEEIANTYDSNRPVMVVMSTDYQLGETLDYITSNKSMTYTEREMWNTPIDIKVKFVLQT